MSDTDICYCGHVRDEHDRQRECQVEGCGCNHFEWDADAPIEDPMGEEADPQ